MSSLKLCRLLSDGAVLQRRKSIHVWGWDEAGVHVTVKLEHDIASAYCDSRGRFDVYLPARESGGPYKLVVSDDKGEEVSAENILIGLVWLCSGQSNMELPVARVRDEYPDVVSNDVNDSIRTFKITEKTSYREPFEELETGSWVCVRRDTIMSFSATAYFFAKKLQEITGQPVGLIDASLGGSRIFSWMSRKMLEGYDDLIKEAERYADDDFYKGQVNKNLVNGEGWRNALYKADTGIKNSWYSDLIDTADWDDHAIPGDFAKTSLDGFIGAVWFRRSFDLPESLAGKSARLFMGTMVDSDTVYVNGIKVGETPYQYPPRKYDIPEGLTREKNNTIAIRLCVENGLGRFTEGKELKLFNGEAEVKLDGVWKCKIGARCSKIPATDFVNWKATGLYNAMTAPCENYPIDGVIWYQGEGNVEDDYDYADLTRRMVNGYRKAWRDDNLPFIAVQLPNFVIDQLPNTDDWGRFRLSQNEILKMPMTGLVVTMGLGEDNDLHPVVKRPIGERLALCAAHIKYGYNGEYTGPVAVGAKLCRIASGGYEIRLELTHQGGLSVCDMGKGKSLEDFYIVAEDGTRHKARAGIQGDAVIVHVAEDLNRSDIKLVQWCCENTYHGGLVVNSTGIALMPFELPVACEE